MIEVFKTNVQYMKECKPLVKHIKKMLPDSCVNFDLDDCDKILRVESSNFSPEVIVKVLHQYGHRCEILGT
jgi:hypothetical protein